MLELDLLQELRSQIVLDVLGDHEVEEECYHESNPESSRYTIKIERYHEGEKNGDEALDYRGNFERVGQ